MMRKSTSVPAGEIDSAALYWELRKTKQNLLGFAYLCEIICYVEE